MKKLEDLKREVVEEGRGHPFVETLVGILRVRLGALHSALEGCAAGADPQSEKLYVLGGRANEVRSVIELITKTEGREE
jgi:hypothetical protein